MLVSALAFAALASWDIADCAIVKNYADALEEREAARREALGKHCSILFAQENEPAFCKYWRSAQETYDEDGDFFRAGQQFGDLANSRCK